MATGTALTPTAIYESLSDEESFVVLGTSMPPSMCILNANDIKAVKTDKLISEDVIEEAIDIVQSHLSNLSDSTIVSYPSIPKVSEQHDLVPLVEKLYLSSTTTSNSSVELSPDEIQRKVDLLVEENIKLKEILHQNNIAMKDQYETLLVWQEDVMKVHKSHQAKFAETKKYIENLKNENAMLNQALATEKSKLNSKQVIALDAANDCNLKEFELETAQKKISALNDEIQILRNEKLHNSELQSSLTAQNENLQKELNNIKQELGTYMNQLQQSDSLQKILLDEIKQLKTRTPDHSQCITREMLDNVQEQLMAAQMHITTLQELHNEDKAVINKQVIRIKELEAEITENKHTMSALQLQVDTYKSDFDEQRQAMSGLTETNTKNETDLLQLQRSNNKLLEEVERLRRDDFIHVGRLANASVSNPTSEAIKFACPKCNLEFIDYKVLENHVYRCIEIDSLF